AGIRIVNAAVQAFGEEAHGIADAQLNDLPMRHRVQCMREIAGPVGRARGQAQDVMLVYPGVIGALGGAIPALESGAWERIERPAFRAQVPLCRSDRKST